METLLESAQKRSSSEKKNPYLVAAERELDKQIRLLNQYVGLRQLQLKAVSHQKEDCSPDPLLDHLEEYALIESKWLSRLHFFYARQQEWEKSCSKEELQSELIFKEREKSALLEKIKQMTDLFTTALKKTSIHYQDLLHRIQRNRPHRVNPSFYEETATFLDIHG